MTMLKQTDVPVAALPVAELRSHLRMGTGFGEETLQDPVLEGFLRAALTAVEAQTGKALVERSVSLSVSEWSRSDTQALPLAPVSAVLSVNFVLPDGQAEVVDGDSWYLRQDEARPEIVATSGAFPVPPRTAEIEILFTAGYGVWAKVPADLRQAVMLLASHYYENRSATQLNAGCMPFGVTALLEPYRLRRVGFGGAK